MKRGVILLILGILLISNVFAQEETTTPESLEAEVVEEKIDVFEDIGEVELKETAGIKPDSPLYAIDDFIEGIVVGDNPERAIAAKEEKVQEFIEMVEVGDVESAKKALERTEDYGKLLEKEVTPDIERRARESSKAITEVLESLDLEGGEWSEVKERVEEHEEREEDIALAAKIAVQIKDLCNNLAQLDPLEYARTCKTEEDSPEWHKEMYSELTEEQEAEAKEFFEVMSNCFQNPEECECDKISITSFANKCEDMSGLAVECMAGDENACMKMDEEDPMDLLPEHLQDVLMEVEMMYGGAQYDMYAPEECEGVDMEECMRIMFEEHAPPECIDALNRGEIDFRSEHQAQMACERIMFDMHAPEECVGLSDPRECEKIMFEKHAPKECMDAGLTGEFKADESKCREMMEGMGPEGFGGPHMGFGANCGGIQDPEERLDCYDSAMQQDHFGDYEEKYQETKERERECAESCSDQGKAWDFSGGDCKCHGGDYDQYDQYYGDYGIYNPGGPPGEYGEYPEDGYYQDDYYDDYYGGYEDEHYGDYENVYYPEDYEDYYPEEGYYDEGYYPEDYEEGYDPGNYEDYYPEDGYYDEGYDYPEGDYPEGDDYGGDYGGDEGNYGDDYGGDESGDYGGEDSGGGDYGGGDSGDDGGGDSGGGGDGGDGGGEGGP